MAHTAYFLSDLHLLTSRSRAHEHFDTMLSVAGKADALILGGDIFDFRWSLHRSVEDSVAVAVEWLEVLCDQCKNCHVHYILGNHDFYGPFIEQLEGWLVDRDNFSLHPYYLRLGSNIFLHGDAADKRMSGAEFEERRRENLAEQMRGPWMNALYDAAVRSRLHVPVPYVAHRKSRVSSRLLHYLRDISHGPEHGVRDVYFGHTHAPLSDYAHGGLRFHNSGAMIHGTRFQILEAVSAI